MKISQEKTLNNNQGVFFLVLTDIGKNIRQIEKLPITAAQTNWHHSLHASDPIIQIL